MTRVEEASGRWFRQVLGRRVTAAAGAPSTSGRADPAWLPLVSVDVTNTGARSGSAVVQVYLRSVDAAVPMPDRQLKAFEKVSLDPGETTTVTIALDQRSFAYWDTERHSWHVPPGAHEILVGSSSRAIHQTARVLDRGGRPIA